MNKFHFYLVNQLNTPQKVLVVIAFVLFLVLNAASLVIALQNSRIDMIRNLFIEKPVSVTAKDISGNNVTAKHEYDDELVLNNQSVINFNGNTLVSTDPIQLIVKSENEVLVNKGVIYMDVASDFKINLNKGELTLNKGVKCIYNSKDQTILIISGKEKLDTIEANSFDLIVWEVDNYSTIPFEKTNFGTNADLISLVSTLKSLNKLPVELENIQTAQGSDTGNSSSSGSGNSASRETINPGVNDCSSTQLSVQLACEIASFRKAQGLATFNNDTKLADVAYTHAIWMSQNNSLSHTETDGSSFGDRCVEVGTECEAEINYEALDLATANEILTEINKNPDNNKYLTFDYSKIGIGVKDNFVTILLGK